MTFQFGKILVIFGVILVGVGLLLMAGGRLSLFGLGRLPGDLTYKGKNWVFYFPLMSSLVVSILLTLIFWVVSLIARK
jgi:hypothetical protein